MAVQAKVFMPGLRDLNRALKTHEKGVRKEIREKFKGVGEIIARQARINARRTFTSRSGDLEKKISPRSLARGVAVVAFARHDGYNYPGRLEFDKGGARAFLFPALDQVADEAARVLSEVLNWLDKEWTIGK